MKSVTKTCDKCGQPIPTREGYCLNKVPVPTIKDLCSTCVPSELSSLFSL